MGFVPYLFLSYACAGERSTRLLAMWVLGPRGATARMFIDRSAPLVDRGWRLDG
jgi:hypothetical protein